jgi:hypothetical protein
MTHKALADILGKHGGGTVKGGRVDLSSSPDVTLFATLGDESLVVEKVRQVDFDDEFLIAVTARNDRYVLVYEDVRAVRLGAAGPSGAGYAS